ncbi:DUF4403 family protein [Novosphingobium aquae]|uniref:DUF4403 family protein n=1 Tax=Novosphingobium aquae TaxID=3133435 RepID=A0ABU8SD14_9SPHN
MTTGIRVRGIWLAIVAALTLAGCTNDKAEVAPPRSNDKVVIPPQSSLIAVPVEADLAQLRAALETAVPKRLWTINKAGQTCVSPSKVKVLVVKIKTPKIKCDLVGEVTRGPLAISGKGHQIIVTMPIRAVIRAQRIAGIIKQETGTANAQVRALITLDMGTDWNPRAKVDIAYDWTREPGIDFMGERIEFTSKADAKLRGVIARLEQTLPRELAKLQVREHVQAAWGKAFTSLQLNRSNPPVWMRVTPQELQFGGYTVQGNRLRINLGMKALTQTFVGPRPADPAASPLPPLRRLAGPPGRMLFFIPVIADYAQLEPVVQKALVKRSARPFEVPGVGAVNATFGKVTLYGTTGGRIAVGVNFTAQDVANQFPRAEGMIWLTGMPVNPPNTQQVTFSAVEVTGKSNDTGTKLLLALANTPAVAQTIGDALGQNFGRDYNKLMLKVSSAIDEKREGKLLIRARIDEIRTDSLKAAGQGLYLPVWGTGTASIELVSIR